MTATSARSRGLAGREVFVCGPQGFMADAANRLTALGVPADRIRQESFGGAILSVARPHQAVRLRIGEREFAGNNQGTVLDQANRQGWSCPGAAAPASAAVASRRCCRERWIPDAPAITAARRAGGKFLACYAIAPDGSRGRIG